MFILSQDKMKAAILIMQLHSAPGALSLPNMKLKEVPATEPNNLHDHIALTTSTLFII